MKGAERPALSAVRLGARVAAPLSFILLTSCLLVACSPSAAVRDTPSARADELGVAGVEAHAAGRYPAAAAAFEAELRLRRSIDDRTGELLALVNRARTLIELGRDAEAVGLLDEAAALSVDGFDRAPEPERKAATALRAEAKAAMAKALLGLGDANGALRAADESLSVEAASAAGAAARLNLKAEALLELGRVDEAERTLRETARNSDRSVTAETANALRIMARARLKRGDADGALDLAERAYGIDRGGELPGKTALDAELLGDIYYSKRETDRAAFMYDRCRKAADGAGLAARAASCAAKLAEAGGARGGRVRER